MANDSNELVPVTVMLPRWAADAIKEGRITSFSLGGAAKRRIIDVSGEQDGAQEEDNQATDPGEQHLLDSKGFEEGSGI